MNQQDFFQEWQTKYSMCFKKFQEYIFNFYKIRIENDNLINDEKIYVYIYKNSCNWHDIPFEMIIGIIEKFFYNEFNIIISYDWSYELWFYKIFQIENEYKSKQLYINEEGQLTKIKILINSYLKTIDIIENNLNNK